jgi:hypothetical protein
MADGMLYLALGEELLRTVLGLLLLAMSTALGMFIFLLGIKRYFTPAQRGLHTLIRPLRISSI